MQHGLAYIIVFMGAGLGGTLRHGVNVAALRLFGPGFPFATLSVNIVGSLAIGLLAGWFALKADPGHSWRLFLTTGLLGGFTTFSTFSLDAVLLYERGAAGMAAAYAVSSVVISIAAVFAGLFLVRQLA